MRALKGRSTHVNDDLGERWALGLARSTNLSMALAAENWGSAYLENKDREGPLELGRRGLSLVLCAGLSINIESGSHG